MALMLNHLEQAGYVDRRKNAIRVTPRGAAALDHCLKLTGQANAGPLSPLDAASLLTWLYRA
jgi:ribosomal protein S19E (S16A)